MYNDERRNEKLTQKLLLEQFVADPERLRNAYEGLVARDVAAKRRSKTDSDRIAEFTATSKAQQSRLNSLEQERRELRAQAARDFAALEAYRKETRRLKDDLKRVRSSRSMRIGKFFTSPAQWLRPTAHSSDSQAGEQRALEQGSAAKNSLSRETEPSGTQTPEPREPKLWELTFEQLLERLDSKPTSATLSATLSRAWFDKGHLSLCEELINKHGSLIGTKDLKLKAIVERIQGELRLRDGRLSIPPRAHGAAYVPESGRVLYCVHSTPVFDSNGYSTRTRGLVEGLKSNGTDVVVASRLGYPWDMYAKGVPSKNSRYSAAISGVDYSHNPGANINSDPIDEYIMQAADAFVREAKIRRPAVIHAASNYKQAMAALIAARRLGVPFVYEVRGLWEVTEASAKDGFFGSDRFKLQVEQETLVASEADHVLAITRQVEEELVARGIDRGRITVIPNAVDTVKFAPLPRDWRYAKSVGVVLDRPVVGFAGSIVDYEGLDILLEAVKLLKSDGCAAQIVIAGSGPAERRLKELAATLEIENEVKFLGRIPAEDVPRLMSLFDLVACPRRSNAVTEMVSPLKPLEALAAGKAVVLSDVAPQVDLLGDRCDQGLLCVAGDSASLADQLKAAISDPDSSRAMARRGRRWVVRERTWQAQGVRVSNAYNAAKSAHAEALQAVPRRPLSSIRLAVVADEFTMVTFGASVQVVAIPRENPESVFDESIDAVLIESAWAGNDGAWRRGIGYYSDDEFAPLRRLLWHAAQRGIPTMFWNKEDPVHTKRFLRAAVRCEHVFTTDSALIGRYMSGGRSVVKSASSLTFFADLTLHNPVQSPRNLGAPRAMYAGTYYGERFSARSKELASILRVAAETGLVIYDRQANNPGSPYKFPEEFRSSVEGALPYDEVIDSYKSHIANINVNSVTGSPTMFSRRVVEVAACGGVVLSGPGRGIEEAFGGALPASGDVAFHRAHLQHWATQPAARRAEAWFQLRTVTRAHTSQTSLAVMFRTIGIPVDGLELPGYIAISPDSRIETVEALSTQSVLPAAIAVGDRSLHSDGPRAVPLINHDEVESYMHKARIEATIEFGSEVRRTDAEDLLHGWRFKGDNSIALVRPSSDTDSRLIATSAGEAPDLVDDDHRIATLTKGGLRTGTEMPALLLIQSVDDNEEIPNKSAFTGEHVQAAFDEIGTIDKTKTVLFAGHDLKFVRPYIDYLQAHGVETLIDQWANHNQHDSEESEELLKRADVVWCEWGLGNAVWYSKRVRNGQKLFVRVHLQEIDRQYLSDIDHESVNKYIFVGDLIRSSAIVSHGVPESRCIVIPNFVSTSDLVRPKAADAEFTLGLVGIVPERKRLDLAIDLLEALRSRDARYRLRIKGKRPEEYAWMLNRPEEMQFYEAQYERIYRLNRQADEVLVAFDPHGSDMADWYSSVGTVLSTSDFESFHLTLADGIASGADAVSLAWDGSDLIYPDSMLFADLTEMAEGILDESARNARKAESAACVTNFYDSNVFRLFSDLILSRG
ncbi:glycosyltransferase [Brachybacterium tyrofermentans]|uniref:glycosyltransferase n=1 Tax=Brachybacterium tyrofermentans TaxID=47848 RepID=UPI003FD394EC